MGQSSADGAGEPIVGKRPLPESWACAATLAQDEETAAWVASQSRKTRQVIRGKRHMEGKAMTREDQVAIVRRRAEISSPCAATLTQEDEAAVVWLASLSKRQRQDVKAILEMNL